MWVVKLGGSLWDSAGLKDWLDQLGALSQPVVLVPGGGPFADQVRRAQAQCHFDDQTAHHMALLAMEQMAHMLCALSPRLKAVAERAALTSAMNEGRVPVWLPSRMILRERQVPASWSVTSDSIAAWLAGRLNARGLLLVKSAPIADATSPITALQQREVLDKAFERYTASLKCPVRVINRERSAALPGILLGNTEAATEIAF